MKSTEHIKCRDQKRSVKASLLFLVLVISNFLVQKSWSKPWNQHTSTLVGLQSKIKALEDNIRELIIHKEHAESADEIKHITDEIVAQHKELKKVSDEYHEEYLHVRFEHPEKGDAAQFKLTRYHLRTIEEMENEMGLEGRLTRIKRKIKRIYTTEALPEEAASAAANTHDKHSGQEDALHSESNKSSGASTEIKTSKEASSNSKKSEGERILLSK